LVAVGLRCGPNDDAPCALHGDQSCIVSGLAATANSSGAFSLEDKYAHRSGWFRQIEAGALSSQILIMRAERLVQLSPKKFHGHDLVHHFADLHPVDILRTRFSSDPSIQKAGL
jgi:hypothetical protein